MRARKKKLLPATTSERIATDSLAANESANVSVCEIANAQSVLVRAHKRKKKRLKRKADAIRSRTASRLKLARNRRARNRSKPRLQRRPMERQCPAKRHRHTNLTRDSVLSEADVADVAAAAEAAEKMRPRRML